MASNCRHPNTIIAQQSNVNDSFTHHSRDLDSMDYLREVVKQIGPVEVLGVSCAFGLAVVMRRVRISVRQMPTREVKCFKD